jgi:3-oxoacyl-[acyl-carrier protein] reductase
MAREQDMRLNGRVALVTGSSRGIGAGIAKRLAADGARLILHAASEPARVEGVAAAIREAGGSVDIVFGDLTTAEAPVRIVQEAFAIHGTLDILVNNAGAGRPGMVTDLDAAAIDWGVALNLRAGMLSTAEFARLTQSPHGRVINITSNAATHGAPAVSVYSAAKAGLEAFSRAAAQELGERGITVNAVAPGPTRTDMVKDPTWFDKVGRFAALRRAGTPEDIADIVAFLASDEGRWLTGLTLQASGGQPTTATNISRWI